MDIEELRRFINNSEETLRRLKRETRHLGLAGERCPHCGQPIETLLNSEGKNPIRRCWRCEVEAVEQDAKRDYHGQ
jgi:hypothetical protein